MRYWSREVAGWVLVGLGLGMFYLVYDLCTRVPVARFFESLPLALIGIFVFRGGINVLKTAVAARVCQQAQDRLYPPPPPALRPLPAQRPFLPPTPTRST